MLRIHQSDSVAAGLKYHQKALMHDDYYGLQVGGGRFYGAGYEMLRREGYLQGDTCSVEDFYGLCRGVIKGKKGEKLIVQRFKTKTDPKERVGFPFYDFNFNPPKSVTLAALNDPRVLDVLENSVDYALYWIEKGIKTRIRKAGEVRGASERERRNDGECERLTENGIFVKFLHTTSRPVKGVSDPQYHYHAILINSTFDRKEREWKALTIKEGVKRIAPYYQAIWRSKLKKDLHELGYETVQKSTGDFELRGLHDRDLIKKFSHRTDEINLLAARLNLDAKKKADLGAKIRKAKTDKLSFDYLKEKYWLPRMTPKERESWLTVTAKAKQRPGDFLVSAEEMIARAKAALDWGIHHTYQRQSMQRAERLIAASLECTTGVSVEAMWRVANKSDRLIKVERNGEAFYTIPEIVEQEKEIINLYRGGRYTKKPVLKYDERAGINLKWPKGFRPTDDQYTAVYLALTQQHKFFYTAGAAGTGKTTVGKVIDAHIKETGGEIYSFAPTAAASRGTMRKEGFEGADTVSSLLRNREKWEDRLRGQWIRVDEFGMLSNRDAVDVMRLCKELDCRALLLGDSRQHGAVEAGSPAQLLEQFGEDYAEMHENVRQKTPRLKKAVELVRYGEIEEGLKLLQPYIVEEKNPQTRYEVLAKYYVGVLKERGKHPLLIAPTHVEGRILTEYVENEMREQKLIKGKEYAVTQLVRKDWTEAEKGYAGNLEMSPDLVKYRGNYYEKRELKLSAGAVVRITENRGGMTNGNTYILKKVAGAWMHLKDPDKNRVFKLHKDFGCITKGYVITSHGSQSRTESSVIVSQAPGVGAGSENEFYVAISRAPYGAKIYTTTAEELRRGIEGKDDQDMTYHGFMQQMKQEKREKAMGLDFGYQKKYKLSKELAKA